MDHVGARATASPSSRTARPNKSVEAYRALTGSRGTRVDLLSMPEVAEVEFEAPRLEGTLASPVDLG